MKKRLLLLIAVIFGIIILLIVKVLYDFGAFRNPANSYTSSLTIEGVKGPEDITIDYDRSLLFISSDDRRARMLGKEVKGGIYSIDLKSESLIPKKISPSLDFEFNPHGISLYKGALGITRLFVINHRSSGHFIEIFDYKNGQLRHLESLTGPELKSPNDLVAVGIRAFYFTNDHGIEQGVKRLMADLLKQGTASVGYFDGKSYRIVADQLDYANGINTSQDGDIVFVSETTGKKISAFQRSYTNGTLELLHSMNLNTGADNIEINKDGTLLVAAHPNMLAFMRHAKNQKKHSPSQILHFSYSSIDGFLNVNEILTDDGKNLSGSSTAAYHGGRLFISNVFDPKILVVTMNLE
ncbi:SMP-30/gluconolactonase/LRE family protein [Peijinzhouia sedimentorum]